MKYKVAILGATGAVGQRFIELLQGHPWFRIEVLAASERSAGKKYRDACRWILKSKMPEEIGEMMVVDTDVEVVSKEGDVDLVFSALPGGIAGPIEEEFAKQYPLVSKARAHRYDEDVPLIVAEINPDHLKLIPIQKERRGYEGFISTDPNCSTIQLVLSLKPLEKFGIKKVVVSTMQALSGAGYPGVPSLDIIDNVIPYISGEEDKLEKEPLKIMGKLEGDRIIYADFKLSASCNRVNVSDGHMESVFVELEEEPSIEEVKNAFRNFRGEAQRLNLPSAPKHPIVVRDEPNRPQPKCDREEEKGMSVVVGRVREDPIMTVKYMCLGHNTVRGAAGAGILSAELLISKNYL